MSTRLFQYRAIDSRGKTMEGSMEAQSSEEVGTWLTERQYYVVDIRQSTLGTLTQMPRIRSIPRPELNYFLIQLSSLIESGCPLLLSLQALHRQLSPGPLKSLVKDLKEKIEVGKSFSEALKAYPDVFSQLFITLVEVGEVGGILSEVLDRYAKIHDAMYRIRSKVLKSMIYPALLLVLTIVFTWALLVWVFPTFIEKFQEQGIPLPLPTQILLTFSNFLRYNWLTLGIGVIIIWQIFRQFRQSQAGGKFLGDTTLHVPLIGSLFKQIELALFSRTLGTLIRCGVPILTSLMAVEKALSNPIYKLALADIRGGVARGEAVSVGMSRRKDLFPDSLILMVDVGERSGNLGDMLSKAAAIYERDLETTLEAIVSLVEPLLVIFLSIFVVGVALAMYLPLFDIWKSIK